MNDVDQSKFIYDFFCKNCGFKPVGRVECFLKDNCFWRQ